MYVDDGYPVAKVARVFPAIKLEIDIAVLRIPLSVVSKCIIAMSILVNLKLLKNKSNTFYFLLLG